MLQKYIQKAEQLNIVVIISMIKIDKVNEGLTLAQCILYASFPVCEKTLTLNIRNNRFIIQLE